MCKIVFLSLLALSFHSGLAVAQWQQLHVPSQHGTLACGPDGTLWLVTNGTLCYYDTELAAWRYQPYPYDLNTRDELGRVVDTPPRQLAVLSRDSSILVSSSTITSGEVYVLVRGEETIHSSMHGIAGKRQTIAAPYVIPTRGRDGEVLLCHDDLYESRDNGAIWQLRTPHPNGVDSFGPGAVDPHDRERLYLFETGQRQPRLHISTDNASTWRIVSTTLRAGVSAANMLLCPDGQMFTGMFHSPDTGTTWDYCGVDYGTMDISGHMKRHVYSAYDSAVYASNTYGVFAQRSDDGLFRETVLSSSTDSGRRLRAGVDIAYDSTSGTLYAIVNDSLYALRDGRSTAMADALSAVSVSGLLSYGPNGDTLLLGTPKFVLISTDQGRSWSETELYGSRTDRPLFTPARGRSGLLYVIYPASDYGQVAVMQDGRRTRKQLRWPSECRLVYDPFSEDTFYGAAGGPWGIWRMRDSIVLAADSNALIEAATVGHVPGAFYVPVMAFDPHREGTMLFGAQHVGDTFSLFRKTEPGFVWEEISSIALREGIVDILYDPVDSNRILVLEPAGVHISTDNGATWRFRDVGLRGRRATCIARDPLNPRNLAIGVDSPSRPEAIPATAWEGGGVWWSADGGETWSKLPIEGLHNYNVTHVAVFANPRRVLAATPCGVYEYPLNPTSTERTDSGLRPTDAQISIQPHPARSSGRIGYSVASPGTVRIALWDMLGREVLRRVEEARLPGARSTSLDLSHLRDGVYMLTIESPGAASSRRLLLRK